MIIHIKDKTDILIAYEKAKKIAEELSFDELSTKELDLIIEELGDNIIKHAIRGTISLKKVNEGIEIVSISQMNNKVDINLIVKDGYSTSGTLGLGLGIIKRYSDDFSLTKGENGELIIKVFKSSLKKDEPFIIETSAYSFPLLDSEKLNGDGYFLKKMKNYLLIGIIDGLGHGIKASEAKEKAIEYLENNYDNEIPLILEQLHEYLKGTRGVAIGLLKLDWRKKLVNYAGIGNTEILIYPSSLINSRPFSCDGIIGQEFRKIIPFNFTLPVPSLFIMYTDGISTRLSLNEKDNYMNKPLQQIGWELIKAYGKSYDDSTIVLCRVKKNI